MLLLVCLGGFSCHTATDEIATGRPRLGNLSQVSVVYSFKAQHALEREGERLKAVYRLRTAAA